MSLVIFEKIFLRNPFGGKPIKEVNVKAACLNGYNVLDNGRFVEVNGNSCFGEVEIKSLYGDVLDLYRGPLHESEALTKITLPDNLDFHDWSRNIALRKVENLNIISIFLKEHNKPFEYIIASGLHELCFNGKDDNDEPVTIGYDDFWALSIDKEDFDPLFIYSQINVTLKSITGWLNELSNQHTGLKIRYLSSISGLFYPYDDRAKELLSINDNGQLESTND